SREKEKFGKMISKYKLIGVEGGEDSCGSTGQGRPRRRLSAEEAPRHAREPLAPGAEINFLL
ncbi:hypothetical protein COJ96_07905, partial [Bacillus sp. AFS073361]